MAKIRRLFTNHRLCSGCRSCSVSCALGHFGVADDHHGAIQIRRDPVQGYEYQVVCRSCEEPECVAACMAVALSVESESGGVLFNRDRCIGCRMCMMVCPHQAVSFDKEAGKVIICDQCQGRSVPICVEMCSTGAIAFVEKDK